MKKLHGEAEKLKPAPNNDMLYIENFVVKVTSPNLENDKHQVLFQNKETKEIHGGRGVEGMLFWKRK